MQNQARQYDTVAPERPMAEVEAEIQRLARTISEAQNLTVEMSSRTSKYRTDPPPSTGSNGPKEAEPMSTAAREIRELTNALESVRDSLRYQLNTLAI